MKKLILLLLLILVNIIQASAKEDSINLNFYFNESIEFRLNKEENIYVLERNIENIIINEVNDDGFQSEILNKSSALNSSGKISIEREGSLFQPTELYYVKNTQNIKYRYNNTYYAVINGKPTHKKLSNNNFDFNLSQPDKIIPDKDLIELYLNKSFKIYSLIASEQNTFLAKVDNSKPMSCIKFGDGIKCNQQIVVKIYSSRAMPMPGNTATASLIYFYYHGKWTEK